MSKTAAGETEVPPAFLLQPQKLISRIKIKNPNPLPIGIKFGFLQCGGRGWIRTTEVVDGRFTVCSLWPLGNLPIYKKTGAGGRTRTPDLLITNQLLYQLSYTSESRCASCATTLMIIHTFSLLVNTFL